MTKKTTKPIGVNPVTAKSATHLGPTVRKAIQRAENLDEIYDIVERYIGILPVGSHAEQPETVLNTLRDKIRQMREQQIIPIEPPLPDSRDLRIWLDWMQRIRIESENTIGDSNDGKTKRKTEPEKIALIAAHLKEQPYATSPEIATATEINEAEVRRLWGPIKKAMKEPKRPKHTGRKADGKTEVIDETAECSICETPKRESFFCNLCDKAITTECKQCHYTNAHPDDAIP